MTLNNARIRAMMANDEQAPRYHFVAPEGEKAMPFDPNGAIFWKGRYHLFYIFQDAGLPQGGHCWGHASSADLLHWEYHPTALAPQQGDPEFGIFSGCALVNKEGVPTLVYLGCGVGICVAAAEDDMLIRWNKSDHNPVIPIPKEGQTGWGVYNVHDPHVWLEGDWYYAILNGRVKPWDIRDTAYLFRSRDLVQWEYLRPFYNPNPHWTGEGEDCACPDFFRLGNRYVLLCISHQKGTRFYVGRYDCGTFVPEEHHRMNWPGGSCFAPESLQDAQGRRIFWAWVVDQRQSKGVVTNALGIMTLPRELTLDAQGRVRITPAAEVESLRRNPRQLKPVTIAAGQTRPLNEISGDGLEVLVKALVSDSAALGIKVRMSKDGTEETVILADNRNATLSIDTTKSSCSSEEIFQRYPMMHVHKEEQRDVRVQQAPFVHSGNEPMELRFFLDRSILEVYADNGLQCMTQRIYPRPDSLGIALFAVGEPVNVLSVDAWDIEQTNG